MNKIKLAIDRFFFKNDHHTDFLIFFRITVGLFLLLHFLSIWGDFQQLYGKYGILPWELQSFFVDEHLVTVPKIVTFFEQYGFAESNILLAFKVTFIIFSVCLIIGLFTRFSAIVVLLMQLAYIKGGWLYTYGVDVFSTMSLFYLVIFPSGRFFSVDNLIFRKRKKEINLMPYRRLFQLHICIAYFFSGFTKMLGINWWNGEAVWKSIHMPYTNNYDLAIDYSWLAQYPLIVMMMGWCIVIAELFYPVFIWIPRTRKIWVIVIISMHLAIALLLGLFFFSAIMIIWNLTTFYLVQKEAPLAQRSDNRSVAFSKAS